MASSVKSMNSSAALVVADVFFIASWMVSCTGPLILSLLVPGAVMEDFRFNPPRDLLPFLGCTRMAAALVPISDKLQMSSKAGTDAAEDRK
jgi:hypothetical protein